MSNSKANLRVGLIAGAVAISMVGVGSAAVPLYRVFCNVTGFGGTTMRVDAAQAATVVSTDKPITIRFDANHRSDLPWEFRPEHPTGLGEHRRERHGNFRRQKPVG